MTDDAREAPPQAGAFAALLKALAALLGVHVQYAQREAADDLGRLASGAALLIVAVLFALVALLVGHAGIVLWVSHRIPTSLVNAALIVAGGDLVVVSACLLTARARMKRPLLEQTRSMVRRTVTSLVESP